MNSSILVGIGTKNDKMAQTINKFWEEYSKLDDYFDRRNKLKELPFIKDLPNLIKIEKCKDSDYISLLSYLIISYFQSYVDDIIEIMSKDRTKELEKKLSEIEEEIKMAKQCVSLTKRHCNNQDCKNFVYSINDENKK